MEDENFVPLMVCIFISKQYVLKQFKANSSVNDIVIGYVVRLPFNVLGGLRAPVKVLATASNPVKMAVTVNSLPQHVELTEPVHIVTSDNSSPRPFI